jgi:hypothetical protein
MNLDDVFCFLHCCCLFQRKTEARVEFTASRITRRSQLKRLLHVLKAEARVEFTASRSTRWQRRHVVFMQQQSSSSGVLP